jgi:ornithine carbamoyltransferase
VAQTGVSEVKIDTEFTKERPFLSYKDLDGDERETLLRLALDFATAPEKYRGILDDRSVGLLFSAPSTRTRTSFWRAATDLGAKIINFGPGDLQLSTGETWADTGRALSEYLDAVVVRTNGPLDEMRALAQHLPSTINALSVEEHPTQAIADYCALYEHFGKVEGIRLAYCGEGNNTAAALALLLTRVDGVRCDFYCPPGYGLAADTAALAGAGERWGGRFRMFDAIPDNPDPVDVVYTTRWQSMGTKRSSVDWRSKFEPFSVTEDVFTRFAEPGRTVLMHDLPAVRGEEVAAEVLDAEYAIVQRQSHHKRTAACAALLWSLGLTTN